MHTFPTTPPPKLIHSSTQDLNLPGPSTTESARCRERERSDSDFQAASSGGGAKVGSGGGGEGSLGREQKKKYVTFGRLMDDRVDSPGGSNRYDTTGFEVFSSFHFRQRLCLGCIASSGSKSTASSSRLTPKCSLSLG